MIKFKTLNLVPVGRVENLIIWSFDILSSIFWSFWYLKKIYRDWIALIDLFKRSTCNRINPSDLYKRSTVSESITSIFKKDRCSDSIFSMIESIFRSQKTIDSIEKLMLEFPTLVYCTQCTVSPKSCFSMFALDWKYISTFLIINILLNIILVRIGRLWSRQGELIDY